MSPDRRRLLRLGLGALLGLTTLAAVPPAPAVSGTAIPTLVAGGTVRTSPFAGGRTSMRDSEGSAYVRRDRAVWLADDDGKRLYEVSAKTGKLRRTIRSDDLASTRRLGGRHRAGDNRIGDMEAVAYDARKDRLFVFSGTSGESARPAVFRLSRNRRGELALDSYQPLPVGGDFTGAAWNPADRVVYVGRGPLLWSYSYARNVVGTPIAVPGLTAVLGMVFTPDGASLLVTRGPALLSRIDWATRTLVPGWTFDLAAAGVPDPRAVELVRGRLWVSDGYDLRPRGDPLDHALFVFDLRE